MCTYLSIHVPYIPHYICMAIRLKSNLNI
jgi:hypothetical protein